jgi:hypothetical protein
MTHLSSEQMSDWILGGRSPDVECHLQDCGRCHQEIVELQSGLRAFQQSVHEWAGQPGALRIPSTSTRLGSWSWAAVSAAAMGAVLLPLSIDGQKHREIASAADSVLLDQVNTRLAQSVPRSMEHLMELMNEGKEGPQ